MIRIDSGKIRTLRKHCLHHNVFPMDIACGGGGAEPVRLAANAILDDCIAQLNACDFDELQAIVNSIPSGLRMTVTPIEEP